MSLVENERKGRLTAMTQAVKAEAASSTDSPKDMKEIVALCKRRGFIFQASDIYGGINGFWDYGPLGVELKNNLRDLWWKHMVLTPPIAPDTGLPVEIVGLDSAIIQNPKAWEASGHVGGFSDPMVDDRDTKNRYRADHLEVYMPKAFDKNDMDENFHMPVFIAGTSNEEIERKFKKLKLSFSTSDCKIVPLTDLDKYLLDRILQKAEL